MMNFNLKNESISKEVVERVFRKTREIQKTDGFVVEISKLEKTDVNEYLLIIFLRLGVCTEPNMV